MKKIYYLVKNSFIIILLFSSIIYTNNNNDIVYHTVNKKLINTAKNIQYALMELEQIKKKFFFHNIIFYKIINIHYNGSEINILKKISLIIGYNFFCTKNIFHQNITLNIRKKSIFNILLIIQEKITHKIIKIDNNKKIIYLLKC